MKQIKKTALIVVGIILTASVGFTQERNLWEKDFIQALQAGKIEVTEQQTEALGYTLSLEDRIKAEEEVLKQAIQKAIDMKAPPCDVMKTAIVDLEDLGYQPYSVLKYIYSSGGDVDLNQLCMCATEKGIGKANLTGDVVARAASEATTADGQPVFQPDEISQAQCFQDIGLGFTEAPVELESIPGVVQPNPESVSAPGAGV